MNFTEIYTAFSDKKHHPLDLSDNQQEQIAQLQTKQEEQHTTHQSRSLTRQKATTCLTSKDFELKSILTQPKSTTQTQTLPHPHIPKQTSQNKRHENTKITSQNTTSNNQSDLNQMMNQLQSFYQGMRGQTHRAQPSTHPLAQVAALSSQNAANQQPQQQRKSSHGAVYPRSTSNSHTQQHPQNHLSSQPLQKAYSRYMDQENYNHINKQAAMQGGNSQHQMQQTNGQRKPRYENQNVNLNASHNKISHEKVRNNNVAPQSSKSANVSIVHSRQPTNFGVVKQQQQQSRANQQISGQYAQLESKGKMIDLSQVAIVRGTDSPPSLSLTVSPEKTTEKRSVSQQKAKMAVLRQRIAMQNFTCSECSQRGKNLFLPYQSNANIGNCAACGCFHDQTSLFMALRNGTDEAQTGINGCVKSLRAQAQSFKAEVPMDMILDRLVQGQTLGKLYNPQAFYVQDREMYINQMYNLCQELNHHPETFHHAVSTYDAFMQREDIMQHFSKMEFLRGKTQFLVLTLISATCIFISAKYHEQTYPGILQLLEHIFKGHIEEGDRKTPFSYDEFVIMEADILNTLQWKMQFISTYDIMTHFFCQGILFSTDKVKSQDKPGQLLDVNSQNLPFTLQHNAEVFADRVLRKHEFLQYDRLTLVGGILMSARKVSHLAELWPEQLVAMCGNRLHYPQLKKVMRHILSFFSEVSCSVTNSVASSPSKASVSSFTVQRTEKRTAIHMIPNQKRPMRQAIRDQSQQQSTQKKASHSIAATHRHVVGRAEQQQPSRTQPTEGTVNVISSRQVTQTSEASAAKKTDVVTPQRDSIPKNKLVSILKNSQEKTYAAVVNQKRGSVGFNKSYSRIQKSVTKKDLSSAKKSDVEAERVTATRSESQHMKETKNLQKQDSSKYLRNDQQTTSSQQTQQQQQQEVNRLGRRATRENTSVPRASSNTKNGQPVYKISTISSSHQKTQPSTSGKKRDSESRVHTTGLSGSAALTLASYLQQQPGRLPGSTSKISAGNYASNSSATAANVSVHGGEQTTTAIKLSSTKSNVSGTSTTLKKVFPHHVIRPARQTSQDLSQSHHTTGQNSKHLTRVRTYTADKASNNPANNLSNISMQKNAQTCIAKTATGSGIKNPEMQGHNHQNQSNNQMSHFNEQLQQRSLQKQFDSIEMQQREPNQKGGPLNNGQNSFVVQTLTTNNQRASSKSSQGSTHSFIHKLTSNKHSATHNAGVNVVHRQEPGSATTTQANTASAGTIKQNQGATNPAASSSAGNMSSHDVLSSVLKRNNFMTAKQSVISKLVQRSASNGGTNNSTTGQPYQVPSAFDAQHKSQGVIAQAGHASVSQERPIAVKGGEPSNFRLVTRLRSGTAMQDISHAMHQAVANSHRSSSGQARQHVALGGSAPTNQNGGNAAQRVGYPPVRDFNNPQIMTKSGAGSSQVDMANIQALVNNIKLSNAVAVSASNGSLHSTGAGATNTSVQNNHNYHHLQQHHQPSNSLGGNYSHQTGSNLGQNQSVQHSRVSQGPSQNYARSTSRGKEVNGNFAKISAMLGKPTSFGQAGASKHVSHGNLHHHQGYQQVQPHYQYSQNQGLSLQSMIKAPNFHPRPTTIRVKQSSDPKDLPMAQIVQASQRISQTQLQQNC